MEEIDSCQPDTSLFTVGRYQKLWKSYVKLRHLLANSPKVKQIDKQKLTQREVGSKKTQHTYITFVSAYFLCHARVLTLSVGLDVL